MVNGSGDGSQRHERIVEERREGEGGKRERIEAEAEAGSGEKTTEAKIIVRFHSEGRL